MAYEKNYALLVRIVWGEPEVYKEGLQQVIDELLLSLPYQRHAMAVRLRFGLDDGKIRTLEETGVLMGVTGSRIRQLEQRAFWRLKIPSRAVKLRSFLTTWSNKVNHA